MKALMTALERRTLKTKLLLGFVILMSLVLAIGVDALIGQRLLGNEIQQMYENRAIAYADVVNPGQKSFTVKQL